MGNRILVVDDSAAIRTAVAAFLDGAGLEASEAGSLQGALELLNAGRFDAAVVDYMLPDGNALELLAKLRETGVQLPIVILTGHGSIDVAVRAIKEGAEQFLTKPVELPALLVILRRMIDGQRARRKEAAGRSQRERRVPEPFLGSSPAIRALAEQAQLLVASESPILIQGETGAGKGVLANWLHSHSPRADEAFVDLNCAGLMPQFLETELFGHERGAFTGATNAKQGLFELANRGTLFLDEIGDVDPQEQPKLLKVLEEKRFRRLGDVRDRSVDVRLVAATHQDLQNQVRDRKFRSDLYFRISALPLAVPSLRDRREDIPILAQRLLEGIGADLGRPNVHLEPDAERALSGYSWPGNIRQLRNVLERAVLLSAKDSLSAHALRFDPQLTDGGAPAVSAELVSLQENEKRYIEQVLGAASGKVDEAARILGLPRSSLYERIKKFGIARTDPGR